MLFKKKLCNRGFFLIIHYYFNVDQYVSYLNLKKVAYKLKKKNCFLNNLLHFINHFLQV